MEMVVVLPAGVATREVLTPLQIINRRLAPNVIWAGTRAGRVPGHDPPITFYADFPVADLKRPPDLLLIPGGFGSLEMALDGVVQESLVRLKGPSTVCLAISTGALVLAAAGLLSGRRVAGHWLSRNHLERFGATPVEDQFAAADRIITAAGSISSEFAAEFAADLVAFGPQQDRAGPHSTWAKVPR
ncbi:MAG TPA: DJ-1/PfpI family protein [Acidimicrobiia bacterium]|nr:DJ-1/PfpI family protein [Acidimicrobiia bacterium]